MQSGYTPTKISTLVDRCMNATTKLGYTPTKISTLVDLLEYLFGLVGYPPTKISTLVDKQHLQASLLRLYAYENFYIL